MINLKLNTNLYLLHSHFSYKILHCLSEILKHQLPLWKHFSGLTGTTPVTSIQAVFEELIKTCQPLSTHSPENHTELRLCSREVQQVGPHNKVIKDMGWEHQEMTIQTAQINSPTHCTVIKELRTPISDCLIVQLIKYHLSHFPLLSDCWLNLGGHWLMDHKS